MKKIASGRLEFHSNISKENHNLTYSVKAYLKGDREEAAWVMLQAVNTILNSTPGLRLKFSRTITAISEDLGMIPEKPGSGVTPDTTPGKTGDDSSEEGLSFPNVSGS